MVKQLAQQPDDHVSTDKAGEIFDNKLKHDQTRQYISSIVGDCLNSVDFMKKVREYAGNEIDSRLFTSAKFWIVTISSAAISAGIGIAITYFATH